MWWSDFDLRQDHDMCLDTWRLYVPFSGSSSLTSLTWTQEESLGHVGLRESLGPRPEPTSAQTLPTRVHHSTGVARFSETLLPVQGPFLGSSHSWMSLGRGESWNGWLGSDVEVTCPLRSASRSAHGGCGDLGTSRS